MSIAPPSDIVLDVAQAADPLKVQAATAKLATMASGVGTNVDFASLLQSQSKSSSATASATTTSPTVPYGRGHQMETKPASPYQKFEAVVLQSFMQSILPKDSDLFGDQFSADAYRSMMSEQLAAQVAKSGRLGIAHAIEAKENATHHVVTTGPHMAASPIIGAAQPSATTTSSADAHVPKTET